MKPDARLYLTIFFLGNNSGKIYKMIIFSTTESVVTIIKKNNGH